MNVLALATRGYICDCAEVPIVSTMAPELEAKALVPDITVDQILAPRTVGQVERPVRPVTRPKRRR
jgi:hypothetical protein